MYGTKSIVIGKEKLAKNKQRQAGFIINSTTLLLLFCMVDFKLFSGIKLIYIFAVPMMLIVLQSMCYTSIFSNRTGILLLLWYLSYFLSIDHLVSIRDFAFVCFGQLVLLAIYSYFARVRSSVRIENYLKILQYGLIINLFVGTLQLSAYYLVGSTWGVSHTTHAAMLPRVCGLTLEPDWYGVVCMLLVLCLISGIAFKEYLFSRGKDLFLLIVSSAMLLFSLVRAAWVGLFITLTIAILSFDILGEYGKELKTTILKIIVILVPIAVVLHLLMLSSENTLYLKLLQRLDIGNWTHNDGGAANSRISAIEIALKYFYMHPVTGNGVGGMGLISQDIDLLHGLGYDYVINAGRGSTNIFITSLFDTGIIGTALLFIYIVSLLNQLITVYKRSGNIVLLKTLLMTISLLIDFQFNNGIRLCVFWVIQGIAIAASQIIEEDGIDGSFQN